MPSSLSFRCVEALLHWCDHFFRIAVANANRRGTTMVYDPDQDRARFGEHATSRKAARAQPSCRRRRRAGDTNSISRRARSMTYHQKMSFEHGRGGFSSDEDPSHLPPPSSSIIFHTTSHSSIATPPPPQTEEPQEYLYHLHKQNTCIRATRISPLSQEAITSIEWEGSTERLKTVRQTAGAKQ